MRGGMLPLTYGAIGKLIGYEMWSIPFINYSLFLASLVAYIWFTRLKPRDALCLGRDDGGLFRTTLICLH
jgi:hypothetical protein